MLIKRTEKDGIVKALYESSNILASKWDGKDLTVIFKRGTSYIYNDVSRSDYMRFETADSQGVILNSKIKAYSFSKGDNVDEAQLIKEMDEAKNANNSKFEKEIIDYMTLITVAYEKNPVISKPAFNTLVEMLVKHSELSDNVDEIKICND